MPAGRARGMDKFDLFLLMQKPIINGYILSKKTPDGKFHCADHCARPDKNRQKENHSPLGCG